jgi:hypothetical protein
VPWKPSYTKDEAREALSRSRTWADALRYLGLSPYGKNFTTIRKWALEWKLDISHLPAYKPRSSAPSFSEQELRHAIANARSWSETLRNMDRCPTGNNWRTIKKYAAKWQIATDHFDPYAAANEALRKGATKAKPLEEILVENSTYSRTALKRRLYETGLKEPICELCGQDENWRGLRISLILDHINGKRNDNRIENLRIVCPNCAAGLETHCGRAKKKLDRARDCLLCGKPFKAKYRDHRYCSRECGQKLKPNIRGPRPERRKVERPPYEQLLDEVKRLGWSAVGRMYGVSDNAIRKWIRSYECEGAVEVGRDPSVIEIPTGTWPNQKRDDRAA